MDKGKLTKVAIVAGILFLLFWNPFTRQVILFILPLGSGYDDFVFLLAGAIAFAAYSLKKWKERKERKEKEQIESEEPK